MAAGRESNGRELRRAGTRLGIGIAAVLAIVLTVAVMFTALRLNVSLSFAVERRAKLSPRAREAVERLAVPVRVTCFMSAGNMARQPVIRLLRSLRVASLEGAGSEIEVAFVSPQRDIAAARQLVVGGVPPESLVFDNGARRITVDGADLLYSDSASNGLKQTVFAGESLCVAVLERLGRGDGDVIYWLSGHGEAAMDDYDPEYGYSDLARELSRHGFLLRSLKLWETRMVPPDATMLAVVAPQRLLPSEEIARIQEYLSKGGRLLYLAPLRGDPGMAETLARWGVAIKPFQAVSPCTLSGDDLVINDYGEHRITHGFDRTTTIFVTPWCVEALAPEGDAAVDRIHTTALASTTAEGWGEADIAAQPRQFDPDTDLAGPVAVAMAAERGSGAAADLGFHATRVVVVGDGYFAANGRLKRRRSANRDLTLNMVNWLCDISAASTPSFGGDATLVVGLDRRGWLRAIFWVCGAAPLALLLLGVVVARRRAPTI